MSEVSEKVATDESKTSELREITLAVRRVNKVVQGGRILSFSVYVAVGDENGKVGFGKGKARDVPEAIKKAIEAAKRNLVSIKLTNGTIYHSVYGSHGAARVYLQPASPGTGRIAGGYMRPLLELVGIKNVLAKVIGSNNHNNVIRATMDALLHVRSPAEIALRRGKPVEEISANHKLLS
jgi:small subunit ribosomal protein S5